MRRRRPPPPPDRQLGLFDAKPAEWPVVHQEVPRHGAIPPYVGPVSDETGGPLCGAEASRVVQHRSIRFGGYLWESGQVVCREHRDAPWPVDAGFRMTVYCGTRNDVTLGRCLVCGVGVVGEDSRQ